MAVKLSAENFDTETSSDGLVIVDFYSDSCVPCKRMSPIIAQLEEENTDIKFGKLNVNFDSSVAEKYEVTSVPVLVFFKDGKEAFRLTGAQKKAQIDEAINNLK